MMVQNNKKIYGKMITKSMLQRRDAAIADDVFIAHLSFFKHGLVEGLSPISIFFASHCFFHLFSFHKVNVKEAKMEELHNVVWLITLGIETSNTLHKREQGRKLIWGILALNKAFVDRAKSQFLSAFHFPSHKSAFIWK